MYLFFVHRYVAAKIEKKKKWKKTCNGINCPLIHGEIKFKFV